MKYESIILIGHSWGAMLIYMFAAKYNHLVKKIILVSSGSIEEKYYEDLCKNRESKLTEEEKCEHSPWTEVHAKDEFYRILKAEIG